MTALRPERESGTSYGQQPYGARGAFENWSPGDREQAHTPYDQGAYRQPPATPSSGETPAPHGPRQRPPRQEPPPAPRDDETVALRLADLPDALAALDTEDADGGAGATGSTAASAASADAGRAGPAHGGRAARRKAAKRRHGRHGGHRAAPAGGRGEGTGAEEPAAPLSRVEARRLARSRRPSAAVVASRVIGEVFITTGVLMLLFVTYQLWWTNVRAHAQAGRAASDLQEDWASGKRSPGAFEPGQGFALLHIPRLDVVVPIAEGTDSKRVLDRGMVGHYADGALRTAMPDDRTGNFGLAGHRNTHGEPFRYINRLEPGDPIVVETQDKYFVYKAASMLPVTPPSNVSVLEPIPRQSGFTGPGRYITLTTCTPEFTSKYRLIVWGKMVEERPRSKGKPDALVN